MLVVRYCLSARGSRVYFWDSMSKRIVALLMILLFAGQASAGGIACVNDMDSKTLNRADEATCSMQSMSECNEMACCTLGKSPTGALAAMICCEAPCGESTGGAQFDFAPQTLIPAPRLIKVRAVLLDAMGEAETAVVSIKSAAYKLLHHDPPDFYLSNSIFLI
jgi:hypothetical protein